MENHNDHISYACEEESWLTVTLMICAIVGAILAGIVVDMYGRRKLILFTSVPFVISWIFVAIPRSAFLMFVERFIPGEIAEPQIRGIVASMCPISIVFGVLIINIIGSLEPIDITAYISIIFPVLLLITFIKMPESPYCLLMKNKPKEALKSLQIFRDTSNVSKEFERISIAVEQQNYQNKGKFQDLFFDKSNRRALLIALGLRGFQQLSGTTAIMFHCKTIFMEPKDILSPSIATITYFSIQLVLSCCSSVIVDFVGRKPLLVLSNIGTALSLFLNGCYLKNCTDTDTFGFNYLPIIALLGFIVAFNLGWHTIPLILFGELFPTNVKGVALCFLDIYNSIMIIITSKCFYWSKDEFGLHVPFLTIGSFCVLALVFILFYVPETKNKTLEDIQEEFKEDE